MAYHALLEYIRKAKDCGASDVDIARKLHASGWYRVDIDDALVLYEKLTQPKVAACEPLSTPKPSLTERMVPRSYDPHLIAVAVVSFVIGFLGYLLLAGR